MICSKLPARAGSGMRRATARDRSRHRRVLAGSDAEPLRPVREDNTGSVSKPTAGPQTSFVLAGLASEDPGLGSEPGSGERAAGSDNCDGRGAGRVGTGPKAASVLLRLTLGPLRARGKSNLHSSPELRQLVQLFLSLVTSHFASALGKLTKCRVDTSMRLIQASEVQFLRHKQMQGRWQGALTLAFLRRHRSQARLAGGRRRRGGVDGERDDSEKDVLARLIIIEDLRGLVPG